MSDERRVFGAFLLEEKLGAGGMGTVYRGLHLETERDVAIKILSPKAATSKRVVARFAREMELLKTLNHPNIVRCYGGGRIEAEAYLVMELMPGGSLASLLRRRGRLSWETVIEFGLQICAGLEYAHEWGVVHRDLTPANLLLTETEQIKIADFGIARVQYGKRLTAAKHTMGTVAYMAPEQITGKPAVSHKTDLYTLGCVLFELLTGELPFSSDSTAQLMYQHISEPPARVSSLVLDCPIWLDALVAQLLEKDPGKRPHSAAAVAVALREIKDKVASGASVATYAAKGGASTLKMPDDKTDVRRLLGRKKRRRRAEGPFYESAWFLAACLLLVVGIVVWSFLPPGEAEMFAKADELMATGERSQWKEAETRYLEPLLKRYPNGKYASQAREHLDRIAMETAEARLQVNTRLGREAATEGERLYADGWRYEQFGDRVTALEKYQGMINVLKDEGPDRPYVQLARRQVAAIMSAAAPKDRVQIIDGALARADQLYLQGDILEAHKLWNGIVTLYSGNRELLQLVSQAQDRLTNGLANDKGKRAKKKPSGEFTSHELTPESP